MGKRAVIVAAALAALLGGAYAALGFWGVPALIQKQAAKAVQEQLGRQASIAAVRFNPFTLHLEAEGLRLAEANGAPLFSIGRLDVRMQWRSIASGAWRFDHIDIAEPAASLVVAPDGRFNIAELLDALPRSKEPRGDDALPPLVIERLRVAGGRIDMDDRQAGYTNAFAPFELELSRFSTLPGERDSHAFVAKTRKGGTIRWTGRATMRPIRAEGEFVVEDASLPELSVYLKSFSRVSIEEGKLSAKIPYSLAYEGGRLDGRVSGAQVSVRELAVVDPRAQPPLRLDVDSVRLGATVEATQAADRLALGAKDGVLTLQGIAVSRGSEPPLKFATAGVEGAALDLGQRRIAASRIFVEGGQAEVLRDAQGAINLAQWWPAASPAPAQPVSTQAGSTQAASAPNPWSASVAVVEATGFSVAFSDAASGIRLHLADAFARATDVGADLKKPLRFSAGLALREGGRVTAGGSMVPATGAVQAKVAADKLALAPLQPLLAQHLRLAIGGGTFSARGQLATGAGTRASPSLRYTGSFDVAQFALDEPQAERFLSWKNVGADALTLQLGPNRLDIPELRVDGADAKLVIEEDRSFRAARLLARPAPAQPAPAQPGPSQPGPSQPAASQAAASQAAASQAAASQAAASPPAAAAAASAGADEEPFAVRVRRVRVQDAKLDFADLSLRPQFSAKVHEFSGAINGLSSSAQARSQVELEGRVDEFGLARVRGELNVFKPDSNTDLDVVFRNVDMVSASPYSMKFAGYRIAGGKISLDLNYRIRERRLEGDNKIVIDRITLGERVDSPDALKIPLQLAIAILQDSDGRIDLGLPVSGDMADPTFSYSAIVWKAIANVLTRIVTAPFRALGAAFGIGGERLEAIQFDAGSARVLPPEREKLQQVARILAGRGALRLAVPGHYNEAADGAALRMQAVRRDVAQRAGLQLAEGEAAGPIDLGDGKVRRALRELYAQRFGEPELDKQMKAAEAAARPPSAGASAAAPQAQSLPVWQRLGRFVQGEPQVADATGFYDALRERLERERALPADALAQLGAGRAKAIAASLAEAGVDASRVSAGTAEAVDAASPRSVAVRLELQAR